MKKEKEYKTWFSADTIKQADSIFDDLIGRKQRGKLSATYRVTSNGESWSYDTIEDFFNAYGDGIQDAKFTKKIGEYSLYISYSKGLDATKIAVGSPRRREIEDIFEIFEIDSEK